MVVVIHTHQIHTHTHTHTEGETHDTHTHTHILTHKHTRRKTITSPACSGRGSTINKEKRGSIFIGAPLLSSANAAALWCQR
jgi:hypothetical protein